MFKHVDLLAVALLLAGIAFFTHARRAAMVEFHSARWVKFTNHEMRPLMAPPSLPKLCLTRD